MGNKPLGYRFAQGFAFGDYEQAMASTAHQARAVTGRNGDAGDNAVNPSSQAVSGAQRSGNGGCADRGADDAPFRRERDDQ
jgi:hypothetical protein